MSHWSYRLLYFEQPFSDKIPEGMEAKMAEWYPLGFHPRLTLGEVYYDDSNMIRGYVTVENKPVFDWLESRQHVQDLMEMLQDAMSKPILHVQVDEEDNLSYTPCTFEELPL